MKKKILIIGIYLLGCLVSYPCMKLTLESDKAHTEWTKGDRAFSIITSSCSWLSVAAAGMTYLIISIDTNEKADW